MTAGVVCQCLQLARLTDHPDTCSSVCWDRAGLVTAFWRTCASSRWALPAWSNRVRWPATSTSRASACSSGNGQTKHLSCSSVVVLVCAVWRCAKPAHQVESLGQLQGRATSCCCRCRAPCRPAHSSAASCEGVQYVPLAKPTSVCHRTWHLRPAGWHPNRAAAWSTPHSALPEAAGWGVGLAAALLGANI